MVGKFMIVKIYYTGCTNYEGNKILVFHGMTKKQLGKLKSIDPHFDEMSPLKLVARFKPDDEGWFAAKTLCRAFKRMGL